MSSKFFTNSSERSLFDKFTGIIEGMPNLHAFHAVVGYFRSSGYFKLQPYLKNLKEIKILVGINVDQMFAEAQRKGMLFFGDEAKAKNEFLNWFIEDIRQAKYSEEVEKGILEFVNDLVDGRIEVRAHNSKAIHAKFYLFLPENHNANSDGWVIMGSSNLTEAGLGIKQSPNYELNIALKDYDDVQFAKGEFEALWKESTPILPADIQAFKERTHIDQTFTPYEIYLKFLTEYFNRNIDYDPDTVGDLPKTFRKLSYQIDAVNEGFQMLMRDNGFFLADVVGLGKTVVAAMIAKRFRIANGSQNTKILVVYPPAVERNWKDTFAQFRLDKDTKFITNGSLEKILNGDPDYWPKEEYDLVLVDEAHRYRNHTSQMFQNLQRICKAPRNGEGLILDDKKRVILISATPLNNRPQDIYYQIQLFQDARRSTLTETNLQSFFGPIIRDYKEIIKDPQPDLGKIREMYERMRERIITPITVRRTRTDLKNYPQYLNDLKEQGIDFPEISAPREIEYALEGKLGELFTHSMDVLTNDVKYFRYQAVLALKEEIRDEFYPQARIVSLSLAGILRNLMVKRLESSFFAFKRTLANVAKATERMIEMFAQDKVFIAPDFDVNALMEKGYTMEEVENYILERTLGETDLRNRIFPASDFEPEFVSGLKQDLDLLNDLIEKWHTIEDDPKLETFFEELPRQFLNSGINATGKLVIFTESKDTANHLHDAIRDRLGIDALNVSAENRKKLFETLRDNFDANYDEEKQKDDHQILITTDVLAEGVNLHRANVIVNYDTPWNATRLMQRIGRVNRIGSVGKVIYSFNFYPSPQGDEYINLYNKALVKLQGFHSAFGEDAKIYTHEEFVEQFQLYQAGIEDEEDKRLYYLRFIREFKDKNPNEFKRIKGMPLKARTARSVVRSNKENADDSTVVFLKSQYKTEFYKTETDLSVSALTFLQAAAIFEAKASEPGFSLQTKHYTQVQAALDEFIKDFFGSTAETVTTTDKADARSNQAKKFLRDIAGITKHEEVKSICKNLADLIDRGTYAQLTGEVRKLKQKLDKKHVTWQQAEAILVELARKFDALEDTSESKTVNQLSANIEPEIVLSETFIA